MNGQDIPGAEERPHESMITNGCGQSQTLDDWVIKALDNLTDDTDDLPSALISTNLDTRIFNDPLFKSEFESIFHQFDSGQVTFQYFKSFKRARINFSNPQSAALARIHCHSRKFGDTLINCYYFYNPVSLSKSGGEEESGDDEASQCHLRPPQLQRLFLISPPASPPVGWEPREEAEPVNYELIAAISRMMPGEPHELHPKSDSHPSIVVHTCDDPVDDESTYRVKTKIQQTPRPQCGRGALGSSVNLRFKDRFIRGFRDRVLCFCGPLPLRRPLPHRKSSRHRPQREINRWTVASMRAESDEIRTRNTEREVSWKYERGGSLIYD